MPLTKEQRNEYIERINAGDFEWFEIFLSAQFILSRRISRKLSQVISSPDPTVSPLEWEDVIYILNNITPQSENLNKLWELMQKYSASKIYEILEALVKEKLNAKNKSSDSSVIDDFLRANNLICVIISNLLLEQRKMLGQFWAKFEQGIKEVFPAPEKLDYEKISAPQLEFFQRTISDVFNQLLDCQWRESMQNCLSILYYAVADGVKSDNNSQGWHKDGLKVLVGFFFLNIFRPAYLEFHAKPKAQQSEHFIIMDIFSNKITKLISNIFKQRLEISGEKQAVIKLENRSIEDQFWMRIFEDQAPKLIAARGDAIEKLFVKGLIKSRAKSEKTTPFWQVSEEKKNSLKNWHEVGEQMKKMQDELQRKADEKEHKSTLPSL